MRPVISSHLIRLQEYERRQAWLWAMLLTLLVMLTGGTLQRAWQINAWSLAFARPALAEGMAQVQVCEPPEGYPHGTVWVAEAALERGDVDAAQEMVESLASQGNPFVLRVLGRISYISRDYTGAVQAFEKVRDRISLLYYAAKLEDKGETNTAAQAYRVVLDEIHSSAAVLPYAELLAKEGETQRAIQLLQNALEQFPASSQTALWIRHLGDLYSEQGKWDEAILAYQKALTLDPQSYWAYIGLGNATYNQVGDPETAIQWYRQAIKIKPESGVAYGNIATTLTNEKRYTEAEPWYEAAIQRNPDIPWWWLMRANNMRAAGNYETADLFYKKAAELSPEWAPIYYEIAWNYRLSDSPEDAISAIEQALQYMDNANPWYYVRAGKIYEWAGQGEKALEAYQQALDIAPENQAAQDGIQKVQPMPMPAP